MADETSIANLALAKLGISPIMALTDDSKQAQFANRFFPQNREEVLAARDWTFAIKRQSLNRLAAAPASEWLYAYQLPSDYLRLVQFNEDEIVAAKHKFALEGNTIVTDAATVTVCYVANITDPALFSPLFVEALATKLAAELSGPLTGSREMMAMYYELYAKLVAVPQAGETLGRTKRAKGASLTATDIANAALSLIGVSPISSFTDTSVQAQLVDRLYDQTRDEVLAVRPWTFAIKRVSPTGTTNAAGSEYTRTYTLPTDYLRLVQIDDDDVDTIQHKYALEGKSLLTDRNPVEICYVARITDVSFYSPLFIEAFTYKLASKLAGPLAQGEGKGAMETLVAAYEKAITTPQVGEQGKRTNRVKSATIDAVEISNMALAMLGVSPIFALTDPSMQAQMADRFYAPTRDELLSMHRWNFAMRRAALVKATPAPSFEWDFAYTLPANCLRVVQLNGYEPTEPLGEFAIENNQLLTDADPAEVRYIFRVTDTTAFPALFVNALATLLASRMAASLGASPELAIALENKFNVLTGPKARMADVFEEHRRIKPAWADSTLIKSRFTSYPSYGV